MKSTRKIFKPIQTLNARTFRSNKGRNLVAVLAVLMTALMFTTLFTLAQSMSKNIVEMTFRQTGYDAQASFRDITEEQAALLAAHPDVREVGTSIVLGIAENTELAGRQVEIAGQMKAMPSTASPLPLRDGFRKMPARSPWIRLPLTGLAFPMNWAKASRWNGVRI